MPELSCEEYVFRAADETAGTGEMLTRQRAPIRGRTEFAASLKVCVDKAVVPCYLWEHVEVQKDCEEGKIPKVSHHL
jgi:hypothetical protein